MSEKQVDIFCRKNEFPLWLALKHHRTHKNESLDFKDHSYLRQIYTDKNPYIIIMKSTQCGVSEFLLIRALAHAIQGMNVFYVFPTDILVNRFVRERLDKSIGYTKYYKSMERMIRKETAKRAESMKLKDIGDGNIAFVGSNSEAGFTEYPADEVIIDELDRCDQANIKMAKERLSHSKYRWQIKVSNPTYEGLGIDAEYTNTDCKHWHIKADCGHWIKINWFEHIVRKLDDGRYLIRDTKWRWNNNRDIYPICDQCGKVFNRKNPGEWIGEKNSVKSGYQISKLFSGTTTIVEMLSSFRDSLKDDEEKQRFYNADLGVAYTAEGAKISTLMIQKCIDSYQPGPEEGIIIAGIDIGTFYNYVIKRILPDGRLKTLYIGKCRETKELIAKLQEYNITLGVIDGAYDTREAKRIAAKFRLMFLCYFGNVKTDNIDISRKILTVQRTPALDAVKEAVVTQNIIYPANTLGNTEFINQMTASTRVFNKDKKQFGKTGVYEWVEGSKEDHWFLATAYCLIAKRLLYLLQ